jgi:LPXTG-motif cell wall-anchored protein
MDSSLVRIAFAVGALVLLGVIVLRRRKNVE